MTRRMNLILQNSQIKHVRKFILWQGQYACGELSMRHKQIKTCGFRVYEEVYLSIIAHVSFIYEHYANKMQYKNISMLIYCSNISLNMDSANLNTIDV